MWRLFGRVSFYSTEPLARMVMMAWWKGTKLEARNARNSSSSSSLGPLVGPGQCQPAAVAEVCPGAGVGLHRLAPLPRRGDGARAGPLDTLEVQIT